MDFKLIQVVGKIPFHVIVGHEVCVSLLAFGQELFSTPEATHIPRINSLFIFKPEMAGLILLTHQI